MKTLKLTISVLAIVAILSFGISSCKKDSADVKNPTPTNPQEQITTVILHGHNHADSLDMPKATWEDLDGAGGNAPVIDTLMLDTGERYHFLVIMLDKTKSPTDTISEEVKDKGDIHQLFYAVSLNLDGKITVEREDLDSKGLPLGLEIHIETYSNSAYAIPLVGNINLVLSHYDGVLKTDQPSPESDLNITFPIKLRKF